MISMAVGGVTDTAARFTVKVDTGPAAIEYSTSADMSGSTTSGSEAVDADGVATVEVTGLSAGTRYYWRTVDNGTTDTGATGQLLTDPVAAGQPASFTVACVGDAGLRPVVPGTSGAAPERLSNHPIFDTLRQRAVAEDWARICHLGDICYYDLGSGNHGLSSSATAAQYRDMWDDILAQHRQHQLYRSVPWAYMWDDHDFGPNNSDSTSPGRDNACTVYRERVPSYDLPAGSGANPTYHSFHIGRVLFVVSDTRADRSPNSDPDTSSKTMLGSAQKTWLDNLLATDTSEALVWLMPSQWIGTSSDSWGNFATERDELVQMVEDNGWSGRVLMVNADKHACAIDTGSGGNASFGGWPVVLCAPLDCDSNGNEHTQYDRGMWMRRTGQYATVQAADDGTDVHLTATVWRGDRAMAWTTLNTGTTTRIGAGSPAAVLAL
ncbi:alkaline phosphatase D family protein [Streptomonospora algeriensis]|uniref:Alkaline phosphatase D family protein n=1 Tax=Streptomonospora algeriensis TaxID=995084 RepID=A0ABW3BCC1_9ACTN